MGAPGGEDWFAGDTAKDPETLLRFLDAFAALPAVVAAKHRSMDLLGVQPGYRVLDAGCGTGSDALVMAQRVLPGGGVVGVDSSEIALASARERVGSREGVAFLRADVSALPFADSEFDATRADRVIQHVTQPEVAVAELVRVTRPGGAVVITEAAFSGAGAKKIAQTRSEPRVLLQFLPLLLHRAGALGVRIDHSDSTVEPGREIVDVMNLPAGPVELRVFHIWGRAPG